MRPLRATYRLQFRNGFGLREATELVPYLDRLGISHIYASPLTTARSGSTHGYDVCSFDEIDPVLGGNRAFHDLVDTLHSHAMGLLLDFVPNHMAASAENRWWRSVLEWGRDSAFADFFDIDWTAPAGGAPGKLLLPILGGSYAEALRSNDLKIAFDAAEGAFEAQYFENRFPLATSSWPAIVASYDRASIADPLIRKTAACREAEASVLKRALAAARDLHQVLADAAQAVSANPEHLHAVLEAQHYRLSDWRMASFALNYRRFFDINELAGVRVDRPHVFAAVHSFVLKLIGDGAVDALRIDHVDGLRDPAGYLRRLQSAASAAHGDGEPFPVYVEKILGPGEHLPADWPVSGTTGYEVLNEINGLFIDTASEPALDATYADLTGSSTDFRAAVAEAKQFVIARLFPGERDKLAARASDLAGQTLAGRDVSEGALREALTALLASFPVYRSYAVRTPAAGADRERLTAVFTVAENVCPAEARPALGFLRELVLESGTVDPRDGADFLARLQQLTGPVMAKALEDTAFYRYQRLVSLNEVGGEPDRFGLDPAAFHTATRMRAARWPQNLIATATHDTKVGEDVRARIDALSEFPDAWRRHASARLTADAPHVSSLPEGDAPEAAMRYRLAQLLVGCWPGDLAPEDAAGRQNLCVRLTAAAEKTIKEAKQRTRWTAPDAAYEDAVRRYVAALLDAVAEEPSGSGLLAFAADVAQAGAVNGIAQLLIKLTAPGVPDIYQGAELWDLNLVDPDNRRPVDYALRRRLLEQTGDPVPATLLPNWQDGAVKLSAIARILDLRRRMPEPFERGEYRPLATAGSGADRAVAFARVGRAGAVITVAPRLTAGMVPGDGLPLPRLTLWGDAEVVLDADLAMRSWTSLLDGAGAFTGSRLRLADLMTAFPGSILYAS